MLIIKLQDPAIKMLFTAENIIAFASLTEHKINFFNVISKKIESSFKAMQGHITDFLMIKDTLYVVGADSSIRSFNLDVLLLHLKPSRLVYHVRLLVL